MDFVKENFEEWTGQKWDCYHHNQNTFTNAASVFLLGKGKFIPQSILGQAEEFNSCSFGPMISPMIKQIQEKVLGGCNPIYTMIEGDPKNPKTNPVDRDPPACILSYHATGPASSGQPGTGGGSAGQTTPSPNANPGTGTETPAGQNAASGASTPFDPHNPNQPQANATPFPWPGGFGAGGAGAGAGLGGAASGAGLGGMGAGGMPGMGGFGGDMR